MTDPNRTPADERRSTLENVMAAVVAMLMTVSAVEVVAILVTAAGVVESADATAAQPAGARASFTPDGAGAVLMTAGAPAACAAGAAQGAGVSSRPASPTHASASRGGAGPQGAGASC